MVAGPYRRGLRGHPRTRQDDGSRESQGDRLKPRAGSTRAAPTGVGAALVQEGWLSMGLPTGTGDSAKISASFCEDPRVELAGIEPASSSVEPGLLRVQSVMSLFSAPALAQTRRRQAQSG